eukprot:gnl/TRDRNA2_/TRDRNA2_81198_c1_seq1.p2 gnl/TRDRNA2_/TRDRNA2_81198_c1~~gnl/TRDRNA2_/TRDRNA2_81198_c1_seq1.p2  ORF type:complete len:101 (+),score=7.79 gnl/TRDRNA2_/TRDRNA2_81198_c1_seq1:72-374(+)
MAMCRCLLLVLFTIAAALESDHSWPPHPRPTCQKVGGVCADTKGNTFTCCRHLQCPPCVVPGRGPPHPPRQNCYCEPKPAAELATMDGSSPLNSTAAVLV